MIWISLFSPNKCASSVSLRLINPPPQLWDQLKLSYTLAEHEMFRKIRLRELFQKAWSKENKHEISPNIHAVIKRFNRVGFICSLLSSGLVGSRAAALSVSLQFLNPSDKFMGYLAGGEQGQAHRSC